MKLLFLLACAGCLDAEPATETVDQALNGDTWITVDDNPYTAGVGASANGIAISPTNHHVLMTGSRSETNGTTTWITRFSPDGVAWSFNTAFKLVATGSSVGYNVAADSLGYFYVTGTAVDEMGRTHWFVERSVDDGATWTAVYNAYGFDPTDTPSGITVDGSDNVYVSGSYTAGGNRTAKILRGASHGTTWSVAFSHAGTGGTENSFAGMCQALVGTQTATFAVGWDDTGGEVADTYYSFDGTTWTHAFSYGAQPITQAYACAPDGGNIAIASGTKKVTTPISSNWINTIWQVGNTQLFADSIMGTGPATLNNYAYGAAHVASPVARSYFAGQLSDGSGVTWHVRFHPDSGGALFSDSDVYVYPSGQHNSIALNAAYDSVRGLFVVGRAVDSSGRQHGIVRHRQ